jgi:hypothetical protein
MKWTLLLAPAAVAASVLGVFLVEYRRQEEAGDLAAICLEWAGIMAAVAIGANLAFLLAFYTRNDALGILGILAGAGAAIFCVRLVLSYAFDPLEDIPLVIQGLFCAFYAVQLARGALRRGDGRLRPSLATILVVLLVCGGGSAAYKWHESRYGAVPFRHMTVSFCEIDGLASIKAKQFLIQFEGCPFGSTSHSGGYQVDGRWGKWFSFAPPQVLDFPGGITARYSEENRVLTFAQQGHRLVYSHPRQTMLVGGTEYSLAGEPQRFLVKTNGEVVVTELTGSAEELSGSDRPRQPAAKTESAGAAPAARDEKATTYYYAIFYGGTKIGHTETVRTLEQGKVRQRTTWQAWIALQPMQRTTETLETGDGHPLWFRSQGGSAFSRKQIDAREGRIAGGRLSVTTIHGGSRTVEERPWPAGALLPEGEALLMKRKGVASGTAYAFCRFETDDLKPTTIHVVVGGRKTCNILGRTERLHEMLQSEAGGPFRCQNYVNDDCDVRQVVMDFCGAKMQLVACSAEYAHKPDRPADTSEEAVVEVPGDMSGFETAARIRYTIVADGTTEFDLPSAASQQVAPAAHGGLAVVVTPQPLPSGDAFPYSGSDSEARAALQPTRFLPCRDPQIVKLAADAAGGTANAGEAVARLAQFVREYIVDKFNDTDVDTATDIIESRRGACRQHAILLAALCRAVGIPARLVGGMIYNAQSSTLSGHAWTQVFLGGRWIDYDPIQGGFHAGHVALRVFPGDPDYGELRSTLGHFEVRDVVLEKSWRDHWPLAVALAGACVVAWLSRPARKPPRLIPRVAKLRAGEYTCHGS